MRTYSDRRLIKWAVERGYFDGTPLTLIDVGCRGGVFPTWREFAPYFRAVGFDPAPGEVEKLRRSAPATEEYSDLAVGNPPAPLTLDEVPRRFGFPYVDFIKTDTDGKDLDVLRSGQELLGREPIGLMVEARLGGGAGEDVCTFHNIDRLLRSHGYALADIDVLRRSQPAMPLPHDRVGTTSTIFGRPHFCDAVYFKIPKRNEKLPLVRALKLACLAVLFRTPDTAATVLLNHVDMPEDERNAALDMLVPSVRGRRFGNFQEYVAYARANPQWLQPRSRATLLKIWSRVPASWRQVIRGRLLHRVLVPAGLTMSWLPVV